MEQAPIEDVSHWPVEAVEQRGRSEGVWLRDESGSDWLYKPNRVHANGSERGEDWAEAVASQLGLLLGLPVAPIKMVTRNAVNERPSRGILSGNVTPAGYALQVGAVLLTNADGFQARSPSGQPPADHVGHNLLNIREALDGVGPPAGFQRQDFSAFDVFAGYLMFDAWIANQDRHEENWAVVESSDGSLLLAASFDHGASLGQQLLEDRFVALHADESKLRKFAERGCAAKFEGRTTSLVALAADGLGMAQTQARAYWRQRLSTVTRADWVAVLAGTPRLSEGARRFCSALLDVNRGRLLRDC